MLKKTSLSILMFLLLISPFASEIRAEAPLGDSALSEGEAVMDKRSVEEENPLTQPGSPSTEEVHSTVEAVPVPEEKATEPSAQPKGSTEGPSVKQDAVSPINEGTAQEDPGAAQEPHQHPSADDPDEQPKDSDDFSEVKQGEPSPLPVIEPNNPFLLQNAQLGIRTETVDDRKQLILTLKGQWLPGESTATDSYVLFQFPREMSGMLQDSFLNATYQSTSLSGERTGEFSSEDIRIPVGSSLVYIPFSRPGPAESLSDDAFTLTVIMDEPLDLSLVSAVFYAQVAGEIMDLSSEPSGFVGQTELANISDLAGPNADPASGESQDEGATAREEASPNAVQSLNSQTSIAAAVPSSRLTFSSVPAMLEFEDVSMTDKTVTVLRKEKDWGLEVNDTRGTGSTWQLLARADRPLTSVSDASITLPNALVFIDKTGGASTLGRQDVRVFDGVTGASPATRVSWDWNAGPLLRFNPSHAPIGDYTALITWTLVDGP